MNGLTQLKGIRAITLLAVLAFTCQASEAEAKKIYSPVVEKGALELAYLFDYTVDNDPAKSGNARHQFELEYGVTDRWMTAIYGDFRKNPGKAFTYHAFKWENIYQLFAQGKQWLDAGLYVEYALTQRALSQPDAVEFKLLLEKNIGAWTHTANIILKKELGTNAGNKIRAGYAWRSRWRWKRFLQPSVELYGSFGELGNTRPLSQQSHQLGPVLIGKLRNGLSYEAGYLFGLTSNSDQGQLKFIIGYEF